ncbi:MAG: lamin tail domain-containing protein [Verrucomicrobia bacterium]|nr:lamin tail domain-containing protein [Verrucomicrobiota bacterium]
MIHRRLSPVPCLLGAALLLATLPANAALRISEFMAENDGFLRDADGDTPDWIELHNEGAAPASLAGWHLTDDPANPAKWTFPAITLEPDAYLVVFASGKDRAAAGAELHTNFQLDNQGDYLALVEPDGVTVAQAFAPAFPPQRSNVSFGAAQQVILSPLLATGALARIHVPTNDALGASWTVAGFDDATWLAGPTGVGYDALNPTNAPGTTVVLRVDFNERGNSASTTQTGFSAFEINTAGGSTTIQTNPTVRTLNGITLTLSHTAPEGYDDRLRSTPSNSGSFTESLLLRDFVFSRSQTSNGGLDLGLAGLLAGQPYRITLWSFDTGSPGSRVSDWFANGIPVRTDYTFGGQNLPLSNDDYRFTFTATADASGRLLISGRRDSSSVDSRGEASFGVFLNALQVEVEGYRAQIATDLQAAMHHRNASAFIRLPFQVPNPAAFHYLTLRLKYDDGLVAYINGHEVGSRNAPASPAWDAAATAAHDAGQDTPFDEILIADPGSLLVAGTNLLAIHGLNLNADDTDFLVLPTLEGLVVNTFADRYFTPPTPGAPNIEGFLGFVADTTFSVDRGFFDAPFLVEISCATPNAEIRWTLDGSAPGAAHGAVYAGPIAITNTTCLRAAAFHPGLIPSDADTHTYLFLDQVVRQSATQPGYPTVWQASYPADYGMDPAIAGHTNYGATLSNDLRSIPTLSIVSDHAGLWDPATGIYPNAVNTGDLWERAASAELIQPDGRTAFAVRCGVRMQGNASRDNVRTPKHSFRLVFRHQYGPTKLRYRWFPDSRVDTFDNIVLRACFTDAWTTRYSPGTPLGERYRPEDSIYLRDVWMKDSQLDLGSHSAHNTFVHLYVNGLYWGLYNPCERLDDSHFAEYFGGRDGDWDVIRDFNELLDGTKDAWNNLIALVNAGITTDAAYQTVRQRVDLENLADFMILHIHAEAEDWPHHNWYAAHRRPTNSLPETRWIFAVWDQEIVADQQVVRNRINVDNDFTPARLYARLRAWPEFRVLFGDRVHRHFFNGGALAPERNIARLRARTVQIDRAIVGESARWGDAREFTIGVNPGTGQTFTRDEWWVPELDTLCTNWFPRQQAVTLERFRAAGLYPSLGAPTFNQFGGPVPAGFGAELTHTNPAGTIFFTLDGSDPRVPGTGAVAPTAQAYDAPILLNATTQIRARVRDGSSWSALTDATFFPPQDLTALAVTELMYNPPGWGPWSGSDLEFLELKNTGPLELDLAGLSFTAGISFTLTNGSRLPPGQFMVLVANETAFRERYPAVAFHGVYSGKLDNAGETVRLATASGSTVLAVTYNDRAPWPITPDNFGFSLVPRNAGALPNSDNGAHWRASAFPGGSPGADDPVPTVPSVHVNEVLTHSVPPETDAIELFNPNDSAADVGGWFLTDDPGQPAKYRLPDPTLIPPGGYIVFTEADFNPVPATPLNFALNSSGDAVYLTSADPAGNLTGFSHGFAFGAAAPGVSFGRYLNSVLEEQFPAQTSPTLAAPNADPRVGPVVIQEIMYHPDTAGAEFIELRNLSADPVPLFDPQHPTNTWRINGLGFAFPQGVTLAPDGLLLVVGQEPGAFRALYAVPAEVPIWGPWTGTLQDSGERLELQWPGLPDTNGVPYITMDAVRYNDKIPWPPAADGGGASLQRREASAYGDDPVNWVAAMPTPGQNFAPGQPPTITTQPQSQTIVAGQNATFNVTAEGSEPLFYQWLCNGGTVSGATNAVLILTNVQPSQAGRYQAVVYNEAGSCTSDGADLVVLILPLILLQPQNATVAPGATVTFAVAATGTGALRYQWRRDGAELPAETNASFTLAAVQPADAGTFTVDITDDIGTVTSQPAQLIVLVVPQIVQGPADLAVYAGESATFTVRVTNTATLPISYRWRASGETYTNMTLHSHTSVLTLPSVDPGLNDTRWDAAITNLAGRAPGIPPRALLTVLSPPRIVARCLPDRTVTLQFLALSNRTYSVLVSERPDPAVWSCLTNLPAFPESLEVTVTNHVDTLETRFYRVHTSMR